MTSSPERRWRLEIAHVGTRSATEITSEGETMRVRVAAHMLET
jgi:hypothetical protein